MSSEEDEVERKPRKISEFEHRLPVQTSIFSTDQNNICCVGKEKSIMIHSFPSLHKENEFRGHTGTILRCDYSPDGRFVASGSFDKTIRVWNIENGDFAKMEGYTDIVRGIRFFPNDGTRLVSGSDDCSIKVWDVERQKPIVSYDDDEGIIRCVNIHPQKETIVGGNRFGEIKVIDFRSRKCIRTSKEHVGSVFCLQFHPHSECLVSGGNDKTIRILDFRTFSILYEYEEVHRRSVRSVCFDPLKGQYLVSASFDKTIKLINLAEKKVIHTLDEHSNFVNWVQISPVDGKYFVSCSNDKKVVLWDFPFWKGRVSWGEEVAKNDLLDRIEFIKNEAGKSSLSEGESITDEFFLPSIFLWIGICEGVKICCPKSFKY